ncbi:MAG TPA: peroxiredoxin, partial [Candidatus Acetothermia bacterium]|nr:peroxiredoxin [Candidatus Acetothermia bacterium]
MQLFHQVTEFAPALYGGKGKSYVGRYLVLYFYPKANTPGCTREAEGFTNLLPEFEGLDATVVGVSPDRPEAQAKFVQAKSLKTMLSDPNKVLARAFGAVKENDGILRSTFLIDRT